MAHGTPDWWGTEETSTVHQTQDAGELAVRLGSPVTFDRRGNVVLVDGFDYGIRGWVTSVIGTGADLCASSLTARTGAYSAKLVTGKTGSMQTGITKYQPRPVLSKIGLEASFAPTSADPITGLQIYHYTGSGYYLFQLRYDHDTEVLQYYDDAGNWQNLATSLAFYPNLSSFNPMKLVVDLVDNEYNRAIFCDSGYPLAGEGGFWVAGASAPYLALYIYAEGDAVDNYTVYLDDVIFTQNEP